MPIFEYGSLVSRIEQAKLEARPERVIQGLVNILLREQPLLNRPHQRSYIPRRKSDCSRL